ncbi:MAG: protease modulator HflC [Nitrospinaceae bacterium]|jgi:membrane protease subunit HflC|nr:protease modulator HflC [Nitrospinaceae bacterium]MDP6656785.1 protease modulator HflC [Nitrospinaceae bacterium]MDP6711262.1 protease modulator HflC [Nitrospinaceae bacterium]MDP7056845.1 protease modulator HflC [Nitrospinaceae bacterium]HAK36939.1 protease modulator HflC [Nitrospina sp.]|tara:strand:+ start:6653 stop:7501 length:849 start_codon:yes stop_codon:yes gene_type:complete
MKQNGLILGLVLVASLMSTSMFTVHLTQTAVLLELQKPKEIITEPGLYFKIPMMQKVRFFSKQLLDNDSPPTEVITRDKKNLLIDNFSLYRITDPLKFLETVRTENGARARLDDIVYSELRVEIGTHDLHDIVTENREKIMAVVTKEANKKTAEYGIEMADVRIKRIDLPPEIANSIFNRMRTERQRIAMEYRSEGKEESTKIRAETDKEKTILIAQAYKQEQTVRGEGDGQATKIYAEAFAKDPEFYSFMRSMEAYKQSLKADTTILLSEDSEFLKFLNKK